MSDRPRHDRAWARRAWVPIVLALAAVGVASAVGALHGGAATPRVRSGLGVGAQASDFSLQAARGGRSHLLRAGDKAVVLSFIDTQADAPSDPSRSQIVFLKSMETQYGRRGLRVLIVDTSRSSRDALVNFTYDWQLSRIPVLADPEAALAQTYDVTEAPTTFLIRPDRTIAQRWDGFVLAAQLAFAVEAVLGGK